MTEHSNYARVAKAIEYIEQNFKQQPSLAEIAEHWTVPGLSATKLSEMRSIASQDVAKRSIAMK